MLAYVVCEAVAEEPGAGAGVVEFAVAGLAGPLPPAAAGVWSAIVPEAVCLSKGLGPKGIKGWDYRIETVGVNVNPPSSNVATGMRRLVMEVGWEHNVSTKVDPEL